MERLKKERSEALKEMDKLKVILNWFFALNYSRDQFLFGCR